MALKILTLDGLSDAKMSELVAKLLETISGVKQARIDFLSQKLTLEIDGRSSEDVVKDVTATLRKNIPSVTIKRIEVGKTAPLQQRQRQQSKQRVPDMSRYDDYILEEEEEEYEEDEELEEEEYEEDEQQEPQETDPNSKQFLIGFACTLGCYLFFSLVFRDGVLAIVSSAATYLLAAVTVLKLKPAKMQGKLIIPKLIVLVSCAAFYFMGERENSLAALLLCLLGFFGSTLMYRHLEKELDGIVAINPEKIKRLKDGSMEEVPLEQVLPGEQIVVAAGMTVPFDGVVVQGDSEVDRSLLTGEEDPLAVGEGSLVACGDRNLRSSLTVRVTKLQEMSTAYKIRQILFDPKLAETGAVMEAKKKVMIFSVVSIAALVLGILYLFAVNDSLIWLPEAFTFLLVVCPCGAAASAKAVQVANAGGRMRHGVILKNGLAQENLSKIKKAIVGYTGILTEGKYTVSDVLVTDEIERKELLRIAAATEHESVHPLANAIREQYAQEREENDPEPEFASWEEVKGRGVRAMVDRQITIAGSGKFMEEVGIEVPPNESGQVCVYIARDGAFIGAILFSDPFRPGAEELITDLKSIAVERVGIMTGCDSAVAQTVGAGLEADMIYSEQSALERLNTMSILMQENESPAELLFIGNSGTADLFAIPCSRIGVGRNAFEILLQYADAMIPSGNLSKISETIQACRQTKNAINLSVMASVAVKVFLFGFTLYKGPNFLLAAAVNALLMVFSAYNGSRMLN